MSLQWLLQRPTLCSVVVGAGEKERREEGKRREPG
jgi:aryl-alcohol dehydrogenase-like predicted oxidoreductase